MDFDAVITGDRAVVARFAEWPKELHDTLLARIRGLTRQLESRVRALAPSRTDTLKDEIISRVFDDPQRIKGMVTLEGGLSGSEYAKAGALEYGAPGHKGRQKVSAYRRSITEAFGRDISPMSIEVKTHLRAAHIEERFYLRGGLAGMEAEAVTELTAAINERLKE